MPAWQIILKCVQAIPEFINTEKTLNIGPNNSLVPTDDTDQIIVSDPISTLIHIDNKFRLCLGEVNGLQVDSCPVNNISFEMLSKGTVTVSYQMMGL